MFGCSLGTSKSELIENKLERICVEKSIRINKLKKI